MATTDANKELKEAIALEKQMNELRTKSDAAIRDKDTRSLMAYKKEMLKVAAAAKKNSKIHKEVFAEFQGQIKATGTFLEKNRAAVKATKATGISLKNLTLGVLGVATATKQFKVVGAYYDRYIYPLDAKNHELAKAFGQVRNSAGDFLNVGKTATMSGKMAAAANLTMNSIYGIKTSLDAVESPLRFLPVGLAGGVKYIELITSAAKILANTMDAVPGSFEETQLSVVTLKEALGATDDDLDSFATHAVAAGTTVAKQMLFAAKASKTMSTAFNVDQKTLSRNVSILRKDFANFGTFSEEQLAKTAAAAQKLGVSMAGITKLNMFDDFDKTAEAAAQLGQSFGINVDAFELFQAEDPADRLRMLQEAAQDAGVDVSQMGRIGLNHFAELAGGMDVADVVKAFSPGNIMRAQDEMTTGMAKKAMTAEEQSRSLSRVSLAIKGIGDSMESSQKEVFKHLGAFIGQIQNMPATWEERKKAVLEAGLAGGGTGEKVRQRGTKVAIETTAEAQVFAASEEAAAMKNTFLDPMLDRFGSIATAASDAIKNTARLAKVFKSKSDLADAYEKARMDGKDITVLFKQLKGINELLISEKKIWETKTKTSFIEIGNATAKFADDLGNILSGGIGAIAKEAFGKEATSKINQIALDAVNLTVPAPIKKILTDLFPKTLKNPSSGPVAMVGTSGLPDLREVNVSSPLQAPGDKLRPQTMTADAGNQSTVIQNIITLEVDGTTIARATLNAPINPGGPTFRNALMNANPLGNDVGTV